MRHFKTLAVFASALVIAFSAAAFAEEVQEKSEDVETVTELAEDEEAPAAHMLGGWKAAEDTAMTEEALDAFTKATEGLLGASYEPVALLASQVVSGTNYCILCKETYVTPDAEPFYTLLYVYRDLQGNAQILGLSDLTIGEIGE